MTIGLSQWACSVLSSRGLILKSRQPEVVQDTPWSYVLRFATTEGYVYLKHTPKLLALEAGITQILHDQFHASVPEIIADNPELNCFLMKDAGSPLRGLLKKQFDASLLSKAIEQFSAIQLAVAEQVDIFLALGVPDWRLDLLPKLFELLLSEKTVLEADGLTAIEHSQLEALQPMVADLCKKLSAYPFKQTIVQCDFHDNNILINEDSQQLTFIDLGEIVISHPFFSLIGCLRQAQFHHVLTEESDAYLLLVDACAKPFPSKQQFSEAFAIAKRLWFIYESLAQNRLRLACDQQRFKSFQRHGKLSGQLRAFITLALS
ncbi:putative phosphotransferase related to Ser/Thr protein kinases [Legionella massiliensis]|uniref:Putative phosphotransferase related to Ser/Thr protein kinases n=1 Tax=Legionella massiliensis TaxID=1034943 RepID=A0A078KQ45_9GAMM|nr:phosphotransferase [Legionella massiliensis]CDZ76490.1 putative phosphotransferase related to Ser/Thr protein kinases [Legionella massiliensis]CEE12228.1 Phosphotransferase enzyme family protein [Legionella massiliensis]